MGHANALSRLPPPVVDPDLAPMNQVLLLEDHPDCPLHTADDTRQTSRDPILSPVLDWVRRGWPTGLVSQEFKPFVTHRDELSSYKGAYSGGTGSWF